MNLHLQGPGLDLQEFLLISWLEILPAVKNEGELVSPALQVFHPGDFHPHLPETSGLVFVLIAVVAVIPVEKGFLDLGLGDLVVEFQGFQESAEFPGQDAPGRVIGRNVKFRR